MRASTAGFAGSHATKVVLVVVARSCGGGGIATVDDDVGAVGFEDDAAAGADVADAEDGSDASGGAVDAGAEHGAVVPTIPGGGVACAGRVGGNAGFATASAFSAWAAHTGQAIGASSKQESSSSMRRPLTNLCRTCGTLLNMWLDDISRAKDRKACQSF